MEFKFETMKCKICGTENDVIKLLKVSWGRPLKSIPVCLTCLRGNDKEIAEEIRKDILGFLAENESDYPL